MTQFKVSKNVSEYFSREDTQEANKNMERHSVSLVTGKIQPKTTETYELTPTRRTRIKRTVTNIIKDVEETEVSDYVILGKQI